MAHFLHESSPKTTKPGLPPVDDPRLTGINSQVGDNKYR